MKYWEVLKFLGRLFMGTQSGGEELHMEVDRLRVLLGREPSPEYYQRQVK